MSDESKPRELDHPCKETCSGWRQGFERGRSAYDALLKENERLEKTIEEQSEGLAHTLGNIGIDVSGAYDFKDLCHLVEPLVHEVEVEKVQIERERALAMLKRMAGALQVLLWDSQHAEHKCGDKLCPVTNAADTLAEYKREFGD